MSTDAATVTAALQLATTPVETFFAKRELLPARPGFYAWWSERGAIAGVPHHPHPLDEQLGLLYIGIGPSRASSTATVRSRMLGQHLGGNISSSTFRFILAALLLDDLRLEPGLLKGRYMLEDDGEAELKSLAEVVAAELVRARATVGGRARGDRRAPAAVELGRQRHSSLLRPRRRGAGRAPAASEAELMPRSCA